MGQYHKILLYIITMFLLNSFHINGQKLSSAIEDSVYCYLSHSNKNKNKNKHQDIMELLIYNGSLDSIIITNFNKYICHTSIFDIIRGTRRAFYWDLLTIKNQKPKDILIITSGGGITDVSEKILTEKNTNIVIPPDSVFVSEVYICRSPFIYYPLGYYKLCLYYSKNNDICYEKNSKCVAEIIVKYN